MDNFFITEDFDWKIQRSSNVDRAINLFTRRIGLNTNTAAIVDKTIKKITGLKFSPTRSGISTCVEQRMNMFHLVCQAIAYQVEGDLVEIGCNQGQSSVLISKILRDLKSEKKLHVFDSFEGLPSVQKEDGIAYKKGDLATTQDVLIKNFEIHKLELPIIHKGWFDTTLSTELPEKICFAHLDGDLYESISCSLRDVYPRLSKGAVCLIDDYCDPKINPEGWNHLPGVKKACDEFMADKSEEICYLYSGTFTHAFFRKSDSNID